MKKIILFLLSSCCEMTFAASIPAGGVITAGGTYSGSFNGEIKISTTSPVTLTDVSDSYTSTPIVTCIANAQVEITQSIFLYQGSIPSGGWTAPSEAIIYLPSPASAYIGNNDVDGGSGVGAPGVVIEGPTTGELDITANAINNCWVAVQIGSVKNNPSVYITWNQCTGDALTERDDQISIYQSTGVTPSNYIYVYSDFVEHDPDALQKVFACQIVVDKGSENVNIDSCYGINGGEGGMVIAYTGANSIMQNCEVLGMSYAVTYNDGDAGFMINESSAGSCSDCTSGFWNTYARVRADYNLLGQGSGNTQLIKADITLQAEENLFYTTFLGAASDAGVAIGKSNQGFSGPTFPNPNDFDF